MRTMEWVTVGTAVGCGLAGGVFFAFSAFAMPALDRLPAAQSVAAMQSINRVAVTPAFMTALFGTALACAGLGVWAIATQGASPWVLAGCGLFLAGVIIVTIGANVPLNNSLASVDPNGPAAARAWAGYLSRWTAWNHVRAAAGLAAAGLLVIGLRFG